MVNPVRVWSAQPSSAPIRASMSARACSSAARRALCEAPSSWRTRSARARRNDSSARNRLGVGWRSQTALGPLVFELVEPLLNA